MLFGDRVHVRLQTLELAARELQSFLLIEAGLLLLGDQLLAVFALRSDALVFFAGEALEFQSRD